MFPVPTPTLREDEDILKGKRRVSTFQDGFGFFNTNGREASTHREISACRSTPSCSVHSKSLLGTRVGDEHTKCEPLRSLSSLACLAIKLNEFNGNQDTLRIVYYSKIDLQHLLRTTLLLTTFYFHSLSQSSLFLFNFAFVSIFRLDFRRRFTNGSFGITKILF